MLRKARSGFLKQDEAHREVGTDHLCIQALIGNGDWAGSDRCQRTENTSQ